MKHNIEFSQYQLDIFENIRIGIGHTLVIARAGAGKSFSIIEGFKHIPKKINGKPTKTLMLAFNKDIANHLKELAPSYITVKTVHSQSLATIKNSLGNHIKVDPNKGLHIIENILHEKGYKKFDNEKFNIAFSLYRTLNLCKGSLVDTPIKIDEIIDRFDIDTFELERDEFIKAVCQALRQCKQHKEVIDFGDMINFPFVFNLSLEKYDRVIIDELQDLSPAQLHIALNSCKPEGRILGMCDPAQILYEFTGVNLNTIDLLEKKLNAKILPLPISYRCSKSIIKKAQTIVPDIQAAPNATQGNVHYINEDIFLSEVKPGDFILSRINSPLIYYCLALLRKGIKSNIKGRDVGNSLNWLIKKSEKKTVPDFLQWLSEWKASETKRMQEKNRDPILIIDKAACLENLCKDAHSLEDVSDNIKTLFKEGDETERVICSSIHRAKGAERNRVFLLWNTLRRDNSQGELNVEYVAITRAKTDLFIVS